MEYQLIISGNKDDIHKVMKVDSLLGALRDIMAMLKGDQSIWDNDGDFGDAKRIVADYDLQKVVLVCLDKPKKSGDGE